jgi:flagellar motor component MotA
MDAGKTKIKDQASKTYNDARSVARCLNVMGLVSLKMGVIGTLLIVIFMFHDLDNWKIKVTMAVITLFYGVIFKLIAYVVEQRVLHHYVH